MLDPAFAAKNLTALEKAGGPMYAPSVLDAILGRWVKEDPAAAGAWVENSAPENRREELRERIMTAQLEGKPPAEAVDFILAQPALASLQEALSEKFAGWMMSDPRAAFSMLAEVPEDHVAWRSTQRFAISASMSRDAENRFDIIDWAKGLPKGKRRNAMLKGLVEYGASNDLDIALQAIPLLPEGRERQSATGSLTELWMRKDPVATSEWLATLKPAPSRDSAVSRFAQILSESDPERAAQWVDTLEKDRFGVRKEVFERWDKLDPAAASAWFESD
jgi:hypothetical protein